jgi:hypothetical protein
MIWQQGIFIYNNRPQNQSQSHSTIISVVCSQSSAFLLLKPYADLIVAIWHHLSLCRTALMFDWVLLCCFVYLLLVFLVEECLEMLEMALRNISILPESFFVQHADLESPMKYSEKSEYQRSDLVVFTNRLHKWRVTCLRRIVTCLA